MSQPHSYPIPNAIAEHTLISAEQYRQLYRRSISDPEDFWHEYAKIIEWITPFRTVKNSTFDPGHVNIRWFEDGTLNVAANCLDRYLLERGNQTVIIWEGDDAGESKTVFYRELHQAVCRFANVLKAQGIGKGDVVALYMPMVPEAVVAMLACARIGAVHLVIFAGFSPEAIAGRIVDSSAKLVVTADEGIRAGRKIPLKKNIDDALKNPAVKSVSRVIVFRRTGHSYLLYGPLACGAITLMFEGVSNWPDARRPTPDARRMAQVVDKHQVNILYTAPTAIRALMAKGDKAIEGTSRKSLRIMGSVGEPINPEAWEWYYHKIGNGHCPIMDTWWQTETGGFMITHARCHGAETWFSSDAVLRCTACAGG